MQVQRLPEGQLDHEFGKVEDRRDPPVAVTVWLPLDAREVDGVLHGWADNPNGGADGLRGLVVAVREYAPGFWAEFCGWVRPEHVRRRDA